MPSIHTHRFVVRYHECDAYGHVNNAHYARYMQEAAFEASAAAGFSPAWYTAHDRVFAVRATQIEFVQQAAYHDSLEVRTWISDARRVTARRQYEIRNTATDALVCRGHSDWVLASSSTGELVSLPPDMLDAFAPERRGINAVKPQAIEQPPLPAQPYRSQRSVRWQDLDAGGVVNNPVYLDYCSDCGFDCTAHFGWTVARQFETGIGVFFKSLQIDYLAPARPNDALQITAWLSGVKRISGTRHFLIKRVSDGAPLARMNGVIVCVDLKTSAPVRWPDAVLADFAPNISEACIPCR
jgi:YbgC/YbaW family acyl-CoA thioester hydrolase